MSDLRKHFEKFPNYCDNQLWEISGWIPGNYIDPHLKDSPILYQLALRKNCEVDYPNTYMVSISDLISPHNNYNGSSAEGKRRLKHEALINKSPKNGKRTNHDATHHAFKNLGYKKEDFVYRYINFEKYEDALNLELRLNSVHKALFFPMESCDHSIYLLPPKVNSTLII
jgi:hypothetical protein